MSNELRQLTPEQRAQILAGIVGVVASVPGPVTYSAMFDQVKQSMNLAEEACGLEIHTAAAALIREGVLNCDERTLNGASVTFSGNTMLTMSRRLQQFVWDDAYITA